MIWLESVFRAFSKDGIQKFLKHSCVPPIDKSFCKADDIHVPDPDGIDGDGDGGDGGGNKKASRVMRQHAKTMMYKKGRMQKRCIVKYHEVDLIHKFRHISKVMGMYPGKVPKYIIKQQRRNIRTKRKQENVSKEEFEKKIHIYPTW